MTHQHELQKAIIAELRQSDSELAARMVVSVVADEVVLSGELESFADKLAAASAVGQMDGVRQVSDHTTVHLDMQRNQRLLQAARRLLGGETAVDDATAGSPHAGTAVSMDEGLLMVTGELDWRRWSSAARDLRASASSRVPAANIADDILNMLPGCFFSTSRVVR